jgi:asparagine synthetase B (glutamine-hydrolysing)
VSSNYAYTLIELGVPFESLYSVPQGHRVVLDVASGGYRLEQYTTLPYGDPDAAMTDLPGHARRVRAALDTVFDRLRTRLAGRQVLVTMSGGLDSSTITALAREHIGDIRGITFSTKDSSPSQQSDLHFARMMAAHCGVPLEVVEVDPASVVELVDGVLIDGQDFRDFNVHCGLVNAALARQLAGSGSAAQPVVLTGDAMNELVADYTPVAYGGSTFYGLPQMSKGRLRRFLVSGLDTGDREVGVFGRRGIDLIQPYTLCAEAYTTLPGGFLDDAAAKQNLARLVVGTQIPAPIYDRPKVRAQVGTSDKVSGTLAALVDAGLDQPALLARFAKLFRTNERGLKGFMRGGLYRFTHKLPAPVSLGRENQ